MAATHRRSAAALLVLASLAASPACASHRGWHRYPSDSTYRVDERAFDIGYRKGFDDGVRDARKGRRFDYARHGEYREADGGYRGYGHRGAYRRAFRDGFVAGYNDGYRRYARRGGYRDRW